MKIKTITYTERRVLAQYEYAELTSTAELSDGENEADAVIVLIGYVQSALKMEMNAVTEAIKEVKLELGPVVHEEPKKEKKTRAKKEKLAPVSDESSNISAAPVEYVEPTGKNKVVYNSNIAEHKSIFGGYLAKKYDNSWKTAKPVDEIKSFTASLNGEYFLDNDGKIVESFLNLVHGFFGA